MAPAGIEIRFVDEQLARNGIAKIVQRAAGWNSLSNPPEGEFKYWAINYRRALFAFDFELSVDRIVVLVDGTVAFVSS